MELCWHGQRPGQVLGGQTGDLAGPSAVWLTQVSKHQGFPVMFEGRFWASRFHVFMRLLGPQFEEQEVLSVCAPVPCSVHRELLTRRSPKPPEPPGPRVAEFSLGGLAVLCGDS